MYMIVKVVTHPSEVTTFNIDYNLDRCSRCSKAVAPHEPPYASASQSISPSALCHVFYNTEQGGTGMSAWSTG